MGDPAGEPELVFEPLDGFLVEADLGLQKLEGDGFLDLPVEGLVNTAHAAPADLLDDFIPAGKHLSPLQAVNRGDHAFW